MDTTGWLGRTAGALAISMVLGACAERTTPAPGAREAIAELKTPRGERAGQAVLRQENGRVRIVVEAQGLTPGQHGIHVHQVGRCVAPDFESAGDHMNPLGKNHGLQDPTGGHAGDLPNLDADTSGRARYTAVTDRLTLLAGPTSVFDADGSAIVIHAKADDQRSEPAGGSGDRVLCGEIVPRGSRASSARVRP
jgi:Cu-Zn family superoxide dismutase